MRRFALGMGAALVVALLNGCSGGGGGGEGGSGGEGDGPKCGSEACTEEEYCYHDDHGLDGCNPKPTSCEPEDHPVCGWDGIIYPNKCEANKAGQSLQRASDSHCAETPSNTYRCGTAFCKIGEEWCRHQAESDDTCPPLPDACKVEGATCECLGFDANGGATENAPVTCGSCSSDGSNFDVTCDPF